VRRCRKVYEDRLRRMARRQLMRIQKSRRRDKYAVGYGGYQLLNDQNTPVLGWNCEATLEEIEACLTDDTRQTYRKEADGQFRWHIP
jgi:hypothetical protein